MTDEDRAAAERLAAEAAVLTGRLQAIDASRDEVYLARAQVWERAMALGMSANELARRAGLEAASSVQKAIKRLHASPRAA